ncbi:hypothetical protein [Gelidibacter salicanalis]|uniref:Uncharacterized protein n=1 Tax=Gelidibacter salicanalis TaxID=291193 RepID=A0A934KS56_9FLAO|nr:hypothetical protein [Gelidibacter salicanalis]MBJ7880421.1 hypothetical protein [Gelidibacter salicanalis]
MEEDFIKLNEEISWKPLERIALSMSGGGLSCSQFSLSYLNHKQNSDNTLLENVKAISSVAICQQ